MHLQRKSALRENVLRVLEIYVTYSRPVKNLNMYDAGENLTINDTINRDPMLTRMNMVAEYNILHAPHQNGKIKRAFPTC